LALSTFHHQFLESSKGAAAALKGAGQIGFHDSLANSIVDRRADPAVIRICWTNLISLQLHLLGEFPSMRPVSC
jgi:hypothetical protein